MSTNALSHKDIKRSWHLVDAKNKILGRVASEVAQIISGKTKSNYVPFLDTGDYVVVVNAEKVKVTGKKETTKTYFRHSGYPSGDRTETLATMRAKKPDEVVRHAVKGMLPKTKLGRVMIKKLHVYAGSNHPYKQQLKSESTEEAAA